MRTSNCCGLFDAFMNKCLGRLHVRIFNLNVYTCITCVPAHRLGKESAAGRFESVTEDFSAARKESQSDGE